MEKVTFVFFTVLYNLAKEKYQISKKSRSKKEK